MGWRACDKGPLLQFGNVHAGYMTIAVSASPVLMKNWKTIGPDTGSGYNVIIVGTWVGGGGGLGYGGSGGAGGLMAQMKCVSTSPHRTSARPVFQHHRPQSSLDSVAHVSVSLSKLGLFSTQLAASMSQEDVG